MSPLDEFEFTDDITPIPLMQLITGSWAAKTLAAAVELDLFGRIEQAGGLSREEAARELGIEDRPADLFLAACASLGLLDKRGESYVNTPLSSAFLVPGRPHYFGAFVRFLDHRQYLAWHELVTALRTNRPTTWSPDPQPGSFEAEDPVMLPLFWEAMDSLSAGTGHELAKALPQLAQHKSLLDVGGGWGTIPIEICRFYPTLHATVYDLPAVCDTTAQKIQISGLSERIATAPGDFLEDDSLPSGHDVIILSMIMHNWDEDTDRTILDKCFRALPTGGMIIISELLLNEQRTGPPRAALMGLTMLIETVGGKNYSSSEYQEWLAEAGFVQIELAPCNTAGANGIIVARKP